jgi:hypothetical protein
VKKVLEGDWSKREDAFDDDHEEKVNLPTVETEEKEDKPNLMLTNEEL